MAEEFWLDNATLLLRLRNLDNESLSSSRIIALRCKRMRRAYCSAAGEIPSLISQVHSALLQVSAARGDAAVEPLRPAVSIKKSITPDHLVCLEDGKKFKSLRRHLRSQYNMTPEQYREKWGLPPDYPMVAPNYAAARSQLAKQMGLGQQRRRCSK